MTDSIPQHDNTKWVTSDRLAVNPEVVCAAKPEQMWRSFLLSASQRLGVKLPSLKFLRLQALRPPKLNPLKFPVFCPSCKPELLAPEKVALEMYAVCGSTRLGFASSLAQRVKCLATRRKLGSSLLLNSPVL